MDLMSTGRRKKGNLIVKTWERCKSFGRSKSPEKASGGRVPQKGCFPVLVGPEMQRFVVRAEYANHALFKELLDEAESEFGFCSDRPLVLPCDVVLFRKVLLAMEETGSNTIGPRGCAPFARASSFPGYKLLNTPRAVAVN